MEAVTGEPIEGDFFEFLRDGSYLCKLLNQIEPGLVAAKFEVPTTQKFKGVSASFPQQCTTVTVMYIYF